LQLRNKSKTQRPTKHLIYGMAVALTLILVGFVATAIGRDRSQPVTRVMRAGFEDFPLWRSVPVQAFAVLGEGTVRKTRWGAYVFRASDSVGSGTRPCIALASITATGAFGSLNRCGPLVPVKDVKTPPTYTLRSSTSRNSKNGPILGEAFLAMTFAPSVSRVRIDISGKTITRLTRPLSIQQSKKANVSRFRYVAFGIRQDVCVRHVEGFDRMGNLVIDANTNECPI
jgi:hypothetical protein